MNQKMNGRKILKTPQSSTVVGADLLAQRKLKLQKLSQNQDSLKDIDMLFDNKKRKENSDNQQNNPMVAHVVESMSRPSNKLETNQKKRRTDDSTKSSSSITVSESISNTSSNRSSGTSHGVMQSNILINPIISPEAPVERIDSESGFKVYKAHLLRVGEGGGTPLCPFDCDCCF